MSAPTKDQLDRYMDLVVGGEEPEDAIAVIWADEPEPPKPAAPKKPTVMVTEFPDGVIIGWDTCAALNGGCGKTVAKCECKTGPKELAVFAKWRAESDTMPNYGNRATKVAPSRPDDARTHVDEKEAANATAREAISKTITKTGQVACALGEHFADIDQADQNDDGTYSCFDCQEKGLQRGRTDA